MKDLEIIYLCAVRYGLGRRTYITSLISDFLLNKKLSQQCINTMIENIEECEDYGDNCDKENWIKLLNYLYEKRNK